MDTSTAWWREGRVWTAICFVLVVFAGDWLTGGVTWLAFYVLAVVASAVMGRPVLTTVISVEVLALTLVGASLNGFAAQDTLRRVLVITFTGLVSVYLAHEVGRARRDLSRQRDLYLLLVENASDVVTRSIDGVLVWVSESVAGLLGWAAADVVGRPLVDLAHPDDRAPVDAAQARAAGGEEGAVEVRLQTAAGDYRWVDLQLRPEYNGAGDVVAVIAGWRDAEAIHEARAALEHRVAHDDLTGALNRDEALARLEMMGRHTRRTGQESAVIFCDVDHFKDVNDTYGHAAGDEVLGP